MTDISVLLHIYRLFKGSVSRDLRPPFFSWFNPIWAPDKQAKVFSNSLSISPRYSITKWDKKKFIINQYFILQIFSFMTDVFTPERISPDCLFKINHRQVKNLILCPRWDSHHRVHLRDMLHTAEITLWSNIAAKSKPNSKIYFRLFISAQMGSNQEKKGSNISWHTAFKE